MNDKLELLIFIIVAVGVTLGGLCWLMVTGIVIHSTTVATVPLLLGAAGIAGSVVLYRFNPERKFGIFGGLGLWLIIINLVFLNLVYDRIPASINGMTTGIDQFSLSSLNILLGIVSLVGFGLLAVDLLRNANTASANNSLEGEFQDKNRHQADEEQCRNEQPEPLD